MSPYSPASFSRAASTFSRDTSPASIAALTSPVVLPITSPRDLRIGTLWLTNCWSSCPRSFSAPFTSDIALAISLSLPSSPNDSLPNISIHLMVSLASYPSVRIVFASSTVPCTLNEVFCPYLTSSFLSSLATSRFPPYSVCSVSKDFFFSSAAEMNSHVVPMMDLITALT